MFFFFYVLAHLTNFPVEIMILSSAERKKLELAEKYKALKESGKLDKYLAKKRKKNAAKERKLLPNERR